MRNGLNAGRICIDEFVQKPVIKKRQYEEVRRKFPYIEGPKTFPSKWFNNVSKLNLLLEIVKISCLRGGVGVNYDLCKVSYR